MSATAAAEVFVPEEPERTRIEDLTPEAMLARVRAARAAVTAAEVEVLCLALAWAYAHQELDEESGEPLPVERVPDDLLAAHFAGLAPEEEPAVRWAWVGIPRVAWDAGAGFATAHGCTTAAGEALLRDALILRHRMPLTWQRVLAGDVPVWRARKVAQAVAGAPDDVCRSVDEAVAPLVHRVGPVTLDRLLTEAMLRLYPEQMELAAQEKRDTRGVRVETGQVSRDGLAHMDITADYPDVAAFDQTLSEVARRLAEEDAAADPDGVSDTIEARRARAVGVLADPDYAAEVLAGDGAPTAENGAESGVPSAESGVQPGRPGVPAGESRDSRVAEGADGTGEVATARAGAGSRQGASPRRRQQTLLVVHLSEEAVVGGDPVGRVEGLRAPVLAQQIASWCGRDAAELRVLPVLDATEHRQVDAYEAPGRLRRVIADRDGHCLFPWCERPASRCDWDHVVPHADGGATCSCNLAPLCRRHHRLKTSGGYQTAVIEPGMVWWRTPHGLEFVVDTHGTRPVSDHPRRGTSVRGNGCLHPYMSQSPVRAATGSEVTPTGCCAPAQTTPIGTASTPDDPDAVPQHEAPVELARPPDLPPLRHAGPPDPTRDPDAPLAWGNDPATRRLLRAVRTGARPSSAS